MNRFVKKNQALVAVLAVAAVIAFGLLVYSGYLVFKVIASNSKIEEFAKSIRTLNNATPHPVVENRKPIQQDAVTYRQAAEKFQPYFGNPYQYAADRFLMVLLEIKDEKELPERREEFIEEYHKEVPDDPNASSKFTEFRERHNLKGEWKAATEAFKKAVLEVSPDMEFGGDADRFALLALGLPYRMSNVDMMLRYYENCRERFSRQVEVQTGAKNFGFASEFTKKYTIDDFQYLVFHLDVIGDIVRRMKAAKIGSVSEFKIENGENALNESLPQVGSVRVARYVFEVNGKLDSIRELAAQLAAANKEHRFYVIRAIDIYANDADYLKARERINPQVRQNEESTEEESASKNSRRARRARQQQKAQEALADKQKQEEEALRRAEESLPFHQRRDYGKTLFGGNEECRAIFDVEYLITGDNAN